MSGQSIVRPASSLRRRTAGWVCAAGLAVLIAAVAVAQSWRDQLPDPVASHWDVNGTADGFSSLNGLVALTLGIGFVLVLGFGAITFFMGHSAVTRRIGAAATIWSALFLSLLLVGTLDIQRGRTDAAGVSGVDGVLLLAILGSLVPAVLVGALVPGDPHLPTGDTIAADAPRAHLAAGERTVWSATTGGGPGLTAGLLAIVPVLVLVVFTRLWVLLIIVGLAGVFVGSMLRWAVRVDGDGLTIRSSFGWPRIRVPLDEVVRADAIDVRPLRDFGGWGVRVGRGGRVGVVLRRGEALLVQRTGGRSVAVTVDGAASAAGVLNALADHARHALR